MIDTTRLRLDRAMEFARQAYKGLKYGEEDYLCHVLRVALRCESPLAKVCALLHDVVEDTNTDYGEIMTWFGVEVADVVWLLTHDRMQDYMEYIQDIKQNRIAREVKIADLEDNIFHAEIYAQYRSRAERIYKSALRFLLE